MTDTYSENPQHASRESLETEFLRRLFARDARVWRQRIAMRDSLLSRDSVTRSNPQIEKAPRQSPSIFEDSHSLGRLS
jgi:hypothetical protein